jgi:hypothetical protein
VLIVGSEPLFSVLTALPWRLLRPRTRIVHWCFDLYPEAAIADGLVSSRNPIVRVLRAVLRAAYRRCDLVGSLGVCMTRLLETYVPTGRIRVYTPWALEEPDVPLSTDLAERQLIFGNAALALMYSGNFGRAHAYEEILALARELKGTNTVVSFSIRGNCAGAVYAAVHPEDSNLNFVDFAPQDRLEQRLGAPDVHLVSLKEAYLGTVVPSKFQGALAAGRPVLFAGPPDSAVARWIDEFGLGWNLTLDNARPIAASLGAWQADPAARKAMNEHCFEAYHRHFSKTAILDAMDKDMRDLLARAPEDPVARSPAGAR